jgi:predicted small metal-binding protein
VLWLGVDCDFLACGKTEDEVLSNLGQHVLAMHGIEGFSKEFYNRARSAIRGGHCGHGDAEEVISEDYGESYESCLACSDERCC